MADIIITTDGTAQLNIEQQPQPVLSIGAFCTGEKGADGRDGYTPIKGVDYFDGKDGAPGKDGKSLTFDDLTESQKAELKGEKGDPGNPGKDGKDADPTKYVSKAGDSITGVLIIDGNQAQIVNISRSQDNLFYGGLDFKKIGSAGNPAKTGIWTELGKLRFWGHDGTNEKLQAHVEVLNNSEVTPTSGGSYFRFYTRCSDGTDFQTLSIAATGSVINTCGAVPLRLVGSANNIEFQIENNSDSSTHFTMPIVMKNNNGDRVRVAHMQTYFHDRTPKKENSKMSFGVIKDGNMVLPLELFGDTVRIYDKARLRFGYAGPDQSIGEGFPEGKIAAAVGSTYIDTKATNGAIRWIKKTGGNSVTGWAVDYGDTGWRDITPNPLPVNVESTTCKIRRVNDMVELAIGYTKITSTTETEYIKPLPQGFQPSPGVFVTGESVGPGTSRGGGVAVDGNRVRIQSSVGQWRTAYVTYSTAQPWPTTLPGAAT